MKTLILGGASFIGSHLAEELLSNGHSVTVFDHNNCSLKNLYHLKDRIKIVGGDFSNESDIAPLVSKADIAFHLVCSTTPGSSIENIIYDAESNIISTIKFLDCCVRAVIKKVIFISSGGTVYGVCNKVPIKENNILNPICPYGTSKMIAEKYLYLYNHLYGLDYTVLRVANAYGERQDPLRGQGVIAVWLDKIIKDKTIEVWGDGTVIRDYIYVKDIVRALRLAAEIDTKERIYNVGSGKGYSLLDVINIFKQTMNKDFEVSFIGARKIDIPKNILDIQLIGKSLGWSPKVSLEDGIANIYNHIKNENV